MTDSAQRSQARRFITETLTRIDGYQARKDTAAGRIEVWRSQDHQARARTRRSLYTVMGQALRVSASRVALAILVVFALAIELGIFLTSPHVGPEPKTAREKRQPARAKKKGGWGLVAKIKDLLGSLETQPEPDAAFRWQQPAPQESLPGFPWPAN